jgi:pimeloyl-ACP methyl ester carboxylesterase
MRSRRFRVRRETAALRGGFRAPTNTLRDRGIRGVRPPGLGPATQRISAPPTTYAKSDDASIAYQVVGDGPIALVLVLGFATHLELQWESPAFARFFERISSFSRLIIFDKRRTGLSDPVHEVPRLEQRIDDVRAVMDAAGSERASLFGVSEGGPMSVLFAATHPARVNALVLHGAVGRTTEAPDYPWAAPAEALRESAAEFIAPIGGLQAEGVVELFAPSFVDHPEAVEFAARMERSAASPAMVQPIFEMHFAVAAGGPARDPAGAFLSLPTGRPHGNVRDARWVVCRPPGVDQQSGCARGQNY